MQKGSCRGLQLRGEVQGLSSCKLMGHFQLTGSMHAPGGWLRSPLHHQKGSLPALAP